MLEVKDVVVRFADVAALDRIDLGVDDRSVVALIGPSGSGKSTLLRAVAGLEHPDDGDVRWDDESILDVPPHKRGFGMMFQDYALFPHRSVAENVAFGLRMQRLPANEIAVRTEAALDLVGLSGYGPRSVGTLSGGEQQRVALARTLAPEPRLVLLDEPLGALDRALRERLVEDMRDIFEEIEATALYVTHDRDEAFAIADRVAVIDHGRIVAEGTPEELWHHPTSARVAELIGVENQLSGAELISLGVIDEHRPPDDLVVVPVRAISVSRDGTPNATVRSGRFRGGSYGIDVRLDSGLRLRASSPTRVAEGDRVRVTIDPSGLTIGD
jgi:ABC-type Fe3+/spermidine/putrescine transport system ATPase subunit